MEVFLAGWTWQVHRIWLEQDAEAQLQWWALTVEVSGDWAAPGSVPWAAHYQCANAGPGRPDACTRPASSSIDHCGSPDMLLAPCLSACPGGDPVQRTQDAPPCRTLPPSPQGSWKRPCCRTHACTRCAPVSVWPQRGHCRRLLCSSMAWRAPSLQATVKLGAALRLRASAAAHFLPHHRSVRAARGTCASALTPPAGRPRQPKAGAGQERACALGGRCAPAAGGARRGRPLRGANGARTSLCHALLCVELPAATDLKQGCAGGVRRCRAAPPPPTQAPRCRSMPVCGRRVACRRTEHGARPGSSRCTTWPGGAARWRRAARAPCLAGRSLPDRAWRPPRPPPPPCGHPPTPLASGPCQAAGRLALRDGWFYSVSKASGLGNPPRAVSGPRQARQAVLAVGATMLTGPPPAAFSAELGTARSSSHTRAARSAPAAAR